MKENEKEVSVWSVFLNILGFLFGAFLVYTAISKKKESKKEEKGEITPKAVKDEVEKIEKIEKRGLF